MSRSAVEQQSVAIQEEPIDGTKPAEVSASAIANTIGISRRNVPPEEKNLITGRNKSSASNNKCTIRDTEFEGESIKTIVTYYHVESKKTARDVKGVNSREQPGAMEFDSQRNPLPPHSLCHIMPFQNLPTSLRLCCRLEDSAGKLAEAKLPKDERSSEGDKNTTHRI